MKTRIALLAALCSFSASLHAGILAGPITNTANNHVYLLLTPSTWGDAEREAVALGGHLATIRNKDENRFVHTNFSNFGGTNRIVWIGLTDKEVEGTFRWISGEEANYRNWSGTEPNNSNGGENRVGIWPSGGGAGQWNDFTGPTIGFGVVEVIPGAATSMSVFRAVEIAWSSQTTNLYRIEWSAVPASNIWNFLAGPIQGTGGTNYYFDSMRDAEHRFYRVLTLPQF